MARGPDMLSQICKTPLAGRFAYLAERGGFEPPKRGLDAYTLSRRAPSTTRTPLRRSPTGGVRPRAGAGILAVAGLYHNQTPGRWRTPARAAEPSGPGNLRPGAAQWAHVVSRPCPQVAPPAVRRTGGPGTRGPGAVQRARFGPRASRLPVHRHPRRGQDHDRADLRQEPELREGHRCRSLRRMRDLPGDRRG